MMIFCANILPHVRLPTAIYIPGLAVRLYTHYTCTGVQCMEKDHNTFNALLQLLH